MLSATSPIIFICHPGYYYLFQEDLSAGLTKESKRVNNLSDMFFSAEGFFIPENSHTLFAAFCNFFLFATKNYIHQQTNFSPALVSSIKVVTHLLAVYDLWLHLSAHEQQPLKQQCCLILHVIKSQK